MRVLITGATGFLGMALTEFLAHKGFTVVATGRDPQRCATLRARGFETHICDLSRPLAPDMFGPCDAIIHVAALSAPTGPRAAFEAANVEATRHIVELARVMGIHRFVNISSPSIYFALRDQLGVCEADPLPAPFNHYARTKAEAESLVLTTPEIRPISLRPRGIYGPGDTTLLPRLLNAARARPLPLFRQGRAKIDLTHVQDVCRAILAALQAPLSAQGQAYNISGGEVLPTRDVIEMTCQRAGVTARWRPMPLRPALMAARGVEALYTLWPGASEPKITAYALALLAFEQSLNIDKAARDLDWRPSIRFDQGLEDVFAAPKGEA